MTGVSLDWSVIYLEPPYYVMYFVVLYSSVYLALLVDSEQLENQDRLLTLFLVLGTN